MSKKSDQLARRLLASPAGQEIRQALIAGTEKGSAGEARDSKTADLVLEIFKAIEHAVKAEGGNIQQLRRIMKRPALRQQIADLIAPISLKICLGENEYSVLVTYAELPSFFQLREEFGDFNLSDLFDDCQFKKHASCKNIDETPGNRIFLVKHFNRVIESEEAIAQMDELGYRPATHLEAYSFQKAYPELQRQFWIIALGSSVLYGDDYMVASLGNTSDGRVLGLGWLDSKWRLDYRFLFVRK